MKLYLYADVFQCSYYKNNREIFVDDWTNRGWGISLTVPRWNLTRRQWEYKAESWRISHERAKRMLAMMKLKPSDNEPGSYYEFDVS